MTTTLSLTGSMLIGAADVRGRAGEVRGVDPATGTALDPVYGLGDESDVDRAVSLAWQAFPSYRATTLDRRARFLESIAGNLDELGDALIERVVAETGIPEARVRGEFARTTGQLRLFASVVRDGRWLGARLDTPDPDRTVLNAGSGQNLRSLASGGRPPAGNSGSSGGPPAHPRSPQALTRLPKPDVRQRMVPLGPVAVFAASNFPLAFSVAGGDTAAAFAAGAPVVVKAHSAHPGTAELVGRAIRDAVPEHGLPEGTFSLLYGSGKVLGTALVTHPRIAAVGFTGSRAGGLALVAAAAARPVPIPVYAEMSSVNPVILLPGALAANAAALGTAFVTSLTTSAGQLCTNPGLVFALGDATGFVAAAAEAVRATPGAPMLNTGIQQSYVDGMTRLADSAGVSEVAGGGVDDTIAACGQARLFETDGDTFLADHTLQEEVFGATSLVVRVRDLDQLLAILDTLEGQLTATVHATDADHETAAVLLPRLELLAGRVVFGGWPTGVEVGHAMTHGGPFPATSAPATTSVGTRAIERFLRPMSYQNAPAPLLPEELRDGNPLGVPRLRDGQAE